MDPITDSIIAVTSTQSADVANPRGPGLSFATSSAALKLAVASGEQQWVWPYAGALTAAAVDSAGNAFVAGCSSTGQVSVMLCMSTCALRTIYKSCSSTLLAHFYVTTVQS
jgi:hypothetical protein